MRAMMSLIVALTMSLSATAALAACYNWEGPRAYLYQQTKQPDGRVWIVIRGSDPDYPNYPRMLVYGNGVLVHNQPSQYYFGYVPKGQVYRFASPNMTTCGTFSSYGTIWYVDNR